MSTVWFLEEKSFEEGAVELGKVTLSRGRKMSGFLELLGGGRWGKR